MNLKLIFAALSFSLISVSCNDADSSDKTTKEDTGIKVQKSMYDNGNLHKVARYDDNKRLSGIQEVYNKKGELQNTMNYNKGILQGESVIYFDNGEKYRITNYTNGKINGERIKYREDGRLWSTQNYLMGMPENNLKEYAENGELKKIPELIVKKSTNSDGSVKVNLSVKGNYKRVKYFNGKLKDGKYFAKGTVNAVEDQNLSKATLYLNKYSPRYEIIAQVTTQGNNHIFLTKVIEW